MQPDDRRKARRSCPWGIQVEPGMAWSADGSYAFAIIRATIVSGQLNNWLNFGRFEFNEVRLAS